MGTMVQYTGGTGNFSVGSNIYLGGWTNTANGWVQPGSATMAPAATVAVTSMRGPAAGVVIWDEEMEPDPKQEEHMVDVLLDLRRKLDAA